MISMGLALVSRANVCGPEINKLSYENCSLLEVWKVSEF